MRSKGNVSAPVGDNDFPGAVRARGVGRGEICMGIVNFKCDGIVDDIAVNGASESERDTARRSDRDGAVGAIVCAARVCCERIGVAVSGDGNRNGDILRGRGEHVNGRGSDSFVGRCCIIVCFVSRFDRAVGELNSAVVISDVDCPGFCIFHHSVV